MIDASTHAAMQGGFYLDSKYDEYYSGSPTTMTPWAPHERLSFAESTTRHGTTYGAPTHAIAQEGFYPNVKPGGISDHESDHLTRRPA